MSFVATVGHELQPFTVGHQTIREPEWVQQHGVRWLFVVEVEVVRGVPGVDNTATELDPGRRRWRSRNNPRSGVADGFQGVARQYVLDVHQQQLLMLMFVVETKGHQHPECVIFWSTSTGTLSRQSCRQEVHHAVVDVSPVITDVLCSRPRDVTAVCTWVSSTD